MVGEARDLGEVRDDKDLPPASEGLEPHAHLQRRLAADAGVHLVENQHREAVRLGACRLDRKHHARQLPARGDPRQWQRGLARVGAEQHLRLLRALRAHLVQRPQRQFERRAFEEQSLELGPHGLRKTSRRHFPRAGQLGRGVLESAARGLKLGLGRRHGRVEIVDLFQLSGQAISLNDRRLDRAAVLPLDGLQQRQPRLHRLQPGRVGIEHLGVPPHLAGGIGELLAESLEPQGQCLQPRIQVRGLPDPRRRGRRADLRSQRLQRLRRQLAKTSCMAGRATFGRQLFVLAGAQRSRTQLVQLEAEMLLLPVAARAEAFKVVDATSGDLRGGVGPRYLCAQLERSSVGVESQRLSLLVEERLVLVLAVDPDQHSPELA